MVDTHEQPAGVRQLKLRYAARCRLCATDLAAGTLALWDPTNKTVRCLSCLIPAQAISTPAEPVSPPDYGMAGASAQRLYDSKEAKRRARLRANWWAIALMAVVGASVGAWLGAKTDSNVALYAVLGAFLPVAKLVARPQHVAAWRIGAAGEQQVGGMLDGLRAEGILAVHDRRVPGRRTNIDHIAVSPAGVFVIDTKNVAGQVRAGRSGLRVAGRRQDKMVSGVQDQVAVVRAALADRQVDPTQIRGVLCFTKADLPWFRPSPGGVLLHYPRGLRKELRQPGQLGPDQVKAIADRLAERLPPA